jgi:hypothetical protein
MTHHRREDEIVAEMARPFEYEPRRFADVMSSLPEERQAKIKARAADIRRDD